MFVFLNFFFLFFWSPARWALSLFWQPATYSPFVLFFYFCNVVANKVLSLSVTVIQTMLDLCDVFSADFDVKFNTTKTVAMRIGPRFDAVCADLTLSGGIIEYVQSLKYLGVCIKTNRTFVCNFDHVKAKFYRTFNCI